MAAALDWPTVRTHLLAVIESRGVTVGQLAAWSGLKRMTVHGALYINADTQFGTFSRILAALGLDLTWVQTVTAEKPKKKARTKR